ncbi:hypothetical protein [Nocardia brasiliensis]
MDEPWLRSLIGTAAVEHRRLASPGAFVRGWRIDTAPVLADPRGCAVAARLIRDLVAPLRPDAVVGIDRAGIPLAQAVAALLAVDHVPASALRTAGTPRGVVIIDDIVNSGRTARRTIRRVRRAGMVPLALVCLIKYPSGRPIRLRACTIPIYTAYSLSDFGLRRSGFRPWRAESALRGGERCGQRR